MNILAIALLAAITPIYVDHNEVEGDSKTMTNIVEWAASITGGGGSFDPVVLNGTNMTTYLTEVAKTNASIVGRIYQLEQGGGGGGGGATWDLRLTKAENIPASVYRGAWDLRSLTSESTANAIGIGAMAFAYLPNLKSVYIGKAGTIDVTAFYQSGVEEITIASGMQSVSESGYDAGNWLNLSNAKRINLPTTVTINSKTFQRMPNIQEVNAPMVTSIGDAAFNLNTSITNFYFPSCITIGGRVLQSDPSLKVINLPACEVIGKNYDSAFQGCTNVEYVIAYNCTNITSKSLANLYACKRIYLGEATDGIAGPEQSGALQSAGRNNEDPNDLTKPRCSLFVRNSMSNLQSISTFPFGYCQTGTWGDLHSKNNTEIFCSDGKLVWHCPNGGYSAGWWTEHPYSSVSDLPSPGDSHYTYSVGSDQYRWSDENQQYEIVQ